MASTAAGACHDWAPASGLASAQTSSSGGHSGVSGHRFADYVARHVHPAVSTGEKKGYQGSASVCIRSKMCTNVRNCLQTFVFVRNCLKTFLSVRKRPHSSESVRKHLKIVVASAWIAYKWLLRISYKPFIGSFWLFHLEVRTDLSLKQAAVRCCASRIQVLCRNK
jgi:hypothetical protein